MAKYNLINQGSTFLLALATMFLVGEPQTLQAQETDSNLTIEDIAEQDNITVGTPVTVRGEVKEVERGISFMLQEAGFFERDEVLVINVSRRILPEKAQNLELQVTGKIGMLVLEDVEREYGLDLDPELYVEYESKPVILANYMVLSPDIDDISDNPDRYYSQEIALEGEVDEIRNYYSFILKEDQLIGGDSLLVINATGEPIPDEDERVVVTGMVRPFIKSEFERDYDLTWNLDIQEQIEAEYTEKPVLVLDRIYPSAKE